MILEGIFAEEEQAPVVFMTLFFGCDRRLPIYSWHRCQQHRSKKMSGPRRGRHDDDAGDDDDEEEIPYASLVCSEDDEQDSSAPSSDECEDDDGQSDDGEPCFPADAAESASMPSDKYHALQKKLQVWSLSLEQFI